MTGNLPAAGKGAGGFALAGALALGFLQAASGASFINLNFEQAQVAPAPAGYTPWDAAEPISAAMAFPGWTAREDSTICTAVWGEPIALDETSVSLVPSSYSPLQGNYSVQLYAWADAPSDYFHTASLSQTGLIPSSARSLRFLMESPPVAGGLFPANPLVTLNGTPILLVPVSASGPIVTLAGDISAFAGQTAELRFTCQGTPGGGAYSENIFVLDGVQFSSQAVPEPAALSLLGMGVSFFACGARSRARRRF